MKNRSTQEKSDNEDRNNNDIEVGLLEIWSRHGTINLCIDKSLKNKYVILQWRDNKKETKCTNKYKDSK